MAWPATAGRRLVGESRSGSSELPEGVLCRVTLLSWDSSASRERRNNYPILNDSPRDCPEAVCVGEMER
jgi:ABC-type antimicrobial peptide transport system ATPase subunit